MDQMSIGEFILIVGEMSVHQKYLEKLPGPFDLKQIFQLICTLENFSRSKITCCATSGEETVFFGHEDSTISVYNVDTKLKEIKLGLFPVLLTDFQI